jgi:uncharacterized protein YegP (UPF0339 family)
MTPSKTSRKMRVEIFRRKDGLTDFRFVAPNGLTVGSTSQGFSSKGNAKRGVSSFLGRLGLKLDAVELVDLTKAA